MEKDTPFLEVAPGHECVCDRMSMPYLGRQAGSIPRAEERAAEACTGLFMQEGFKQT